jgi:hypothetical protein
MRGVVPAAHVVSLGHFRSGGTNPLSKTSAIDETSAAKLSPRDSFQSHHSARFFPETFMTVSMAHIQPIVALIAGILILVMPRLLNFIVAIYLIFIGIIGLGIIK